MKNSLGLPLQGSSSFFLGCCLVGFSFSSRAGKSSDAGYLFFGRKEAAPGVKEVELAEKLPVEPPERVATNGPKLKAGMLPTPAKGAGNANGAPYPVGTKFWIGY
jgi:hypothetical protein